MERVEVHRTLWTFSLVDLGLVALGVIVAVALVAGLIAWRHTRRRR